MLAAEARRAARRTSPSGNRRRKIDEKDKKKGTKRTEISRYPRRREITTARSFYSTHHHFRFGIEIPLDPLNAHRINAVLCTVRWTSQAVDRLGRFPRDQQRSKKAQSKKGTERHKTAENGEGERRRSEMNSGRACF